MAIINVDEVKKSISLLKGDELVEIRVIYGDRLNYSGYFKDVDVLARELSKLDLRNANVYFTLGYVNEACYSRQQKDCFVKNAKNTTSDKDIEAYKWLLIDLDPTRPAATSSSAEQVNMAKAKMMQIRDFLRKQGFPDPIVGFSGNGYHLLYLVDMKADEERKALVKQFLETLDAMFSDENVGVDKKTFNPARVCKLYGTLAQKGSNTEERPHRMSGIAVDKCGGKVDKAYLKAVCDLIPKDPERRQYNSYSPGTFDLDSWLDKYGLQYRKEEKPDGTKYILHHCPFDESHKGKDAVIFQRPNGAIGFNCLHDSCHGKKWQDVRKLFEPDAYERKWQRQDQQMYGTHNRNTQQPKVEGDVWLTAENILNKPKQEEVYIRTGIAEFDKKYRGLKKRGVTILSGYTGGAKSTLLSQIVLNAINDGNNVAVFSGELSDVDFMQWMYQQAAGKPFVEPSKYEDYYNVPIATRKKIAEWLGRNFWLYNNDHGFNYRKIADQCLDAIKSKKLDMICLDNLMAFDIADLSDKEYSAQKEFMWGLHMMAMQNNIHIVLVAHPRKVQGLIGWQDIFGSSTLVNIVDTMAVVYRVNQQFTNAYKDFFRRDHDLDDATNVLAVVKARHGSVNDYYIPLWYEKESKRLKNDKTESKVYCWVKDGFIPVDEEDPFA